MRVPVYERQIGTRPLPTPAFSGAGPADMGAAVAEGLSTLGSDLARIGEVERQKADAVVHTRSLGQLAELQTSLTVGENGYRRRLGVAALGAADDAVKAYKDGAAKIRAGLSTQDQVAAFDAALAGKLPEFAGDANAWEYGQSRQADTDTTKASLASITAAAGQLGTPAAAESAIADGTAVLGSYGQRMGWSAETLGQAVAAHRSDVREDVIRSYVRAGRVADAGQYYRDHQDDIVPDRRDAILSTLKPLEDDAWIDSESAKVWAQAGGDLQKARDILDKDYASDPRAHRVMAAVASRAQIEGEAAEARYKPVKDRAWQAFTTNGHFYGAIPADVRASLRGTDREELQRADQQWRDLERARAAAQRDPVADRQLKMQQTGRFLALLRLSREHPDLFASRRLEQDQPFLDDSDYRKLAEAQMGAQAGDGPGSQVISPWQHFDFFAQRVGLIPVGKTLESSGLSTDQTQALLEVKHRYTEWIGTHKRGETPTYDERESFLAKNLIPVRLSVSGSDPQTYLGAVTPEQASSAYAEKETVPAREWSAISDYLVRSGRPHDDEAVGTAWVAAKTGRDRGAARALDEARPDTATEAITGRGVPVVVGGGGDAQRFGAAAAQDLNRQARDVLGPSASPARVQRLVDAFVRGDVDAARRILKEQ